MRTVPHLGGAPPLRPRGGAGRTASPGAPSATAIASSSSTTEQRRTEMPLPGPDETLLLAHGRKRAASSGDADRRRPGRRTSRGCSRPAPIRGRSRSPSCATPSATGPTLDWGVATRSSAHRRTAVGRRIERRARREPASSGGSCRRRRRGGNEHRRRLVTYELDARGRPRAGHRRGRRARSVLSYDEEHYLRSRARARRASSSASVYEDARRRAALRRDLGRAARPRRARRARRAPRRTLAGGPAASSTRASRTGPSLAQTTVTDALGARASLPGQRAGPRRALRRPARLLAMLFTYDGVGRLDRRHRRRRDHAAAPPTISPGGFISISDGGGTVRYQTDEEQQGVTTIAPNGHRSTGCGASRGRVVEIEDARGKTTAEYDARGKNTKITVPERPRRHARVRRARQPRPLRPGEARCGPTSTISWACPCASSRPGGAATSPRVRLVGQHRQRRGPSGQRTEHAFGRARAAHGDLVPRAAAARSTATWPARSSSRCCRTARAGPWATTRSSG